MHYCGTTTDFVVVVHYVVVVDAVEVSRRTFLCNGHRPPNEGVCAIRVLLKCILLRIGLYIILLLVFVIVIDSRRLC